MRSSSKSGLFLIELIIAIVFFAVASAICVQLFVKAYLTTTRSRDIGTASLIAQNCAEQYKAPGGELLPEDPQYYDAQGHPLTTPEGAVYRLQADDSEADGLHSLTLSVYKQAEGAGPELVYTLDVKRYDG